MKNKLWISLLSASILWSCHSPIVLSSVQPQKNIAIASENASDKTVEQTIIPYKKALENQMNAKISHTEVELTKQGDNSNLGNLLADYTLQGARQWAAKNGLPITDASVINIGGIRTSIGQGDILLKHVYEVMPFENEVVIMKMSGKDLEGLFQYYLETQKNNPVSGFLIETENKKITQALINGAPINPNQTYYIATSDYLAFGGDNMRFFSRGEMINTGIKLRDLFIEKFKENPEVKTPKDIRLIFKDKAQE
ncbi:5'-nucleotidase [Bergeyella sp. RCAD1439]|uniref:5'-nucleotidase n=1 Tax=Bergeyella anatis TaxID=3113737 RepID=UPI002E189A40|nr:5'-nucleotidase [Bergeyella sp. RCAD1439]